MNELTKLRDKQARLDTQQAARSDFRAEWHTNNDVAEHHRPIDKQAHLAVEVHVPCLHVTASIGCIHPLSTLEACWLFPLPSPASKTITMPLVLWERGDVLCWAYRVIQYCGYRRTCDSGAENVHVSPFAWTQGTFRNQYLSWNIYFTRLLKNSHFETKVSYPCNRPWRSIGLSDVVQTAREVTKYCLYLPFIKVKK
jgi:hypothetical protein